MLDHYLILSKLFSVLLKSVCKITLRRISDLIIKWYVFNFSLLKFFISIFLTTEKRDVIGNRRKIRKYTFGEIYKESKQFNSKRTVRFCLKMHTGPENTLSKKGMKIDK